MYFLQLSSVGDKIVLFLLFLCLQSYLRLFFVHFFKLCTSPEFFFQERVVWLSFFEGVKLFPVDTFGTLIVGFSTTWWLMKVGLWPTFRSYGWKWRRPVTIQSFWLSFFVLSFVRLFTLFSVSLTFRSLFC